MRRWREPIEQAAATGPSTGRLRALVRVAAAVACDALGTLLDLALEADTEGDPVFAAWLGATCAVMDSLHRPGPAWQARAQTLVAELRASPDAAVRDLAAIVDANLLLLQDRFDEAADAFEAAIRHGGETWAAQQPVMMVGDCHLFAERPQAALPAVAPRPDRRPDVRGPPPGAGGGRPEHGGRRPGASGRSRAAPRSTGHGPPGGCLAGRARRVVAGAFRVGQALRTSRTSRSIPCRVMPWTCPRGAFPGRDWRRRRLLEEAEPSAGRREIRRRRCAARRRASAIGEWSASECR